METIVTVQLIKYLKPTILVEILAARTKVFVVEQKCTYQEMDAKDFTAWYVQLRQNQQLVVYARIVAHDEPNFISFGRVLVVDKYQHQQLGTQLIKATLAAIKERYPQQAIKIQAQNYLRDFYAEFGFQAVSAVYLEDGIPHVDTVRTPLE
ncbi:GNAT family N-acetyltransferase [Lactobacillus sp. DCY120]|uniref:GNAT family N-acetyltransferase n=1 Tax=Bombilactobacillus apium TaxID=2675299 RepID=A0A850R3N5_9LACO|nr:GNAT family N-acetyltransferase [Bombilactobacillus apium]NVY96581.1 GNAT family N-acetyltransferase [Bombilactobacillus apium]